jgi:hypothetical protein
LGAKLQGRLAEPWQLASGWGREPVVRSALTVPPVSTVAALKSEGSAQSPFAFATRQEQQPMHIRYGFNIEIEVPNLTTVVTAFDVHPKRRAEIVEERPL